MHLSQHSRSKADVILRDAEAVLIILWASMKGWSLHTHRPETILGSVQLQSSCCNAVNNWYKALYRQDQVA